MESRMMNLRERHRRDTRLRIAEAAYECAVAMEPGGSLSAEEIADRVGISRRTFFNHVAGIDAALGIPVEDYLEAVRLRFMARPASETVFEAMEGALGEVEPELVERLARFCALPTALTESSARHQMAAWERYERAVRDGLRKRLRPGADPLLVSTLSAAVMGAGRAAFEAWASAQRKKGRKHGIGSAGLTELIVKALRYLGGSFPALAGKKEGT
jgi:AcrR family transcriptional regulator